MKLHLIPSMDGCVLPLQLIKKISIQKLLTFLYTELLIHGGHVELKIKTHILKHTVSSPKLVTRSNNR